MPLIGLSGKALAGKDTVADYLIAEHGWDRKIAFADNLKEACMSIFSLSHDQVYKQEDKNSLFVQPVLFDRSLLVKVIRWMNRTHSVNMYSKDFSCLLGTEFYSPRHILQYIGTEVMRYYVPNYHVEVVLTALSDTERVVIVDVRYMNELEGILSAGGRSVRINRPDYLRPITASTVNTCHLSEIALDSYESWDYVINNEWSEFPPLYREIDLMLEELDNANRISDLENTSETLPPS